MTEAQKSTGSIDYTQVCYTETGKTNTLRFKYDVMFGTS
jgi:hypothetical protein